jgi:hypothetical protein
MIHPYDQTPARLRPCELGSGLGLGCSGGSGSVPALDLNFLTGALDSRITFTRGSAGTYVGSDGLIASAATNVARFDYDPVTLALRGLLLEEARTNLILRSAEFGTTWTALRTTVSANAIAAPDGTTTADKHTPTVDLDTHTLYQGATTTAASHTFSVFAKAAGYDFIIIRTPVANYRTWFNLATGAVGTTQSNGTASITSFGNGWYRCSVTVTTLASADNWEIEVGSADGTSSFAGDTTSGVYVWGAQLEAGSFATSYVATAGSQVTRSMDSAVMTGASFTNWYNPLEGTFVADFSRPNPTGSQIITTVHGGSAANRMTLQTLAPSGLYYEVITSSSGQAGIQPTGSVTANVAAKLAGAYKANDFGASFAGGTVGTDTSGSVPTVTTLTIGRDVGTSCLNGHIRSLRYYRRRLANATLQSLTI